MDNYRQLASVLAQQFVRYAQHEPECKSWNDVTHKHQNLDSRSVCADFPCTCGLIEVLQPLMPTIKLTAPVPEENRRVLQFTRIQTTEQP